MTNHYPKAINWLVKIGIKILFPSPNKAAIHLLNSMFMDAKYLEFIGPTIFGVWGKTKNKKLKSADENEINSIYKIAENYYKKLKLI